MTTPTHQPHTVLITGASGYVGGLLVPRALDRGWQVRVLTRRATSVSDQPWAERVEVVEGDATDLADLRRALEGVDVAYYLLHSMDGTGDFRDRDRTMAHGFVDAARDVGTGRLVYLSGLHPEGELSPHLASRVEVGQIMLDSGVPSAVLQAAVLLGDGSASFDMLRYLTTRLPVMVAPKWLRNRVQPIAVEDALHYLIGAAELPPEVNRTFDIGGPDVLTYKQMMQGFAAATGLRQRLIVTLPVLTPGLASHWVGLVTPLDAGLAKPLVGSLVHEVVVRERDIDTMVGPPPGGTTPFRTAVQRSMASAEDDPNRYLLVGAAATAAGLGLGAIGWLVRRVARERG